jgi:hypothetical protein
LCRAVTRRGTGEQSTSSMPELRPGSDAPERAGSPGAADPPVQGLSPPLRESQRDAVLGLPLPARHHRAGRALVPAVPPALRRRGRAARRARRDGRSLDHLRLGRGVHPAVRGGRAPLPPWPREQLERGRDRCGDRGQTGVRLPGHRRAWSGRRWLRERAARDRRRGGLLPPRHRGHRRHPGRGHDRRRGRLPTRARDGAPAPRARGREAHPATHRARSPAPQGPTAPDARVHDARRSTPGLPRTPSCGTCAAASTIRGS